MPKTLEEIVGQCQIKLAESYIDTYGRRRLPADVRRVELEIIKSACLEYAQAQDAKIAELQTKLTETNERLMARELLLTHQHDDLVKAEARVKELESIAAFARHRTDCLFYKEMPCNCGLKSAQQPKEP